MAERAIQTFPSEHRTVTDEQTGVGLHQLTDAECINHTPYYLTSAFSPDEEDVLFTSYRTGEPQLYEVTYPDGVIRQLTNVENLHPMSAVYAGDGSEIYYTRDGTIEAVDRSSLSTRTVFELEGGEFGECNLGPDGHWIVSAYERDGSHGLVVTDRRGTEGGVILEFDRTVIHPQFHPTDPGWIEFASDPAPRMHRIRRDGSEPECLYEHGNDEFVVHETFLGNTGDLIFTIWPESIQRLDWETGDIEEIANLNAWHITANQAGSKILCDTNHPDVGVLLVDVDTGAYGRLFYSESSNGGTQWKKSRYATEEDWEEAAEERDDAMSWMEMDVDTVYGPQWTHPHPAFSPDETKVSFTSDRSGHPQVYVAEIET